MQVLNGYISYVRLLLKPRCDFVLVNRNGGQHGKLVFDAIGKCIHPTRYRQVVETQKLYPLTSEEQRILSEDQKHSSAVAKVHCQKQRSWEVALKGHECLLKLQGAKGSEVDEDFHARLGDSTSNAVPSVEKVQNISSSPEREDLSEVAMKLQKLRNMSLILSNLHSAWAKRATFLWQTFIVSCSKRNIFIDPVDTVVWVTVSFEK